MCFSKAHKSKLVKWHWKWMCYTTNKPCYSPSTPQAGRSEQRAFHRRPPQPHHPINGVKRLLSTQSLLAEVWQFILSTDSTKVEGNIRWLRRLEASSGVEERSQACGCCYHWGLLQRTSPEREPSCANWASPWEMCKFNGIREVVSGRICRLAGSHLVFCPKVLVLKVRFSCQQH